MRMMINPYEYFNKINQSFHQEPQQHAEIHAGITQG